MISPPFRSLRRRNAGTSTDEIAALGEGLERPVEERDIDTLVPVILPNACLTLDWPGPIAPLGSLPFALAWATMPTPNRFIYVTQKLATYWEDLGIDWRRVAMTNLVALGAEQPWTAEKCDDDGNPFVLVLLHHDAIGPSRLLVPHLFDDVLGKDYRVAIPEQTCAIAYKANLSAQEESDVDAMIEGCFRDGTEPMSPGRFEAARFWIFDDPPEISPDRAEG